MDASAPICLLQLINEFLKLACFNAIFGCKPLRLCQVHFLSHISYLGKLSLHPSAKSHACNERRELGESEWIAIGEKLSS